MIANTIQSGANQIHRFSYIYVQILWKKMAFYHFGPIYMISSRSCLPCRPGSCKQDLMPCLFEPAFASTPIGASTSYQAILLKNIRACSNQRRLTYQGTTTLALNGRPQQICPGIYHQHARVSYRTFRIRLQRVQSTQVHLCMAISAKAKLCLTTCNASLPQAVIQFKGSWATSPICIGNQISCCMK